MFTSSILASCLLLKTRYSYVFQGLRLTGSNLWLTMFLLVQLSILAAIPMQDIFLDHAHHYRHFRNVNAYTLDQAILDEFLL